MLGPALLQIADRPETDLCQVGEFLLSQPRGAAVDANQWTYPRATILWLGPGLVRHSITLICQPGVLAIAHRASFSRKTWIASDPPPEPIRKEWYAGSLIS
jgi:hypothetical protein